MDFAKKLKELRKKSGLSQAQLSHLCNTKVTNISRYEMGMVKPNIEMAVLIAKGLGVSLDALCSLDVSEGSKLVQLAKKCSKLPKSKVNALELVLQAFCK